MQDTIELGQILTAAVGVLALLVGTLLNRKIKFLSRVCIPVPVSGGLLVACITLVLRSCAGVEFSFDPTIQNICMLMFFTTVGYQCDFSSFKTGGKPLLILIGLVAVLIVMQNAVSVGIAAALGLEPVFGMVSGSIPMCGGHGTAAGFNALLEDNGIANAATITMSTATFGLIAGSLLGGPLSEMLIRKHHLSAPRLPAKCIVDEDITNRDTDTAHDASVDRYMSATFEIFIAMGLGVLLNKVLSLTGISFPTYFGSLLCAIILRNVTEALPCRYKIHSGETSGIGSVCLSLFLGMAMCSLRLWELAGLALPLMLMLTAEVILIALFCRFLAFPLLGRNYNAAVLVGGLCGFGLGATSNAMANMSAVCRKNGYTPVPFIITPIAGSAAGDIINITIITLFMHFL